jgi:predicted Rdx family selenoprotein
MNALRNEVDPSDLTDHSAKPPMALTIIVLGTLHALCCGLPLLVLSGVSLTTIFPTSPMIGGGLALIGLVVFVWHRKKAGAFCQAKSLECCAGEMEARQKSSKDVNVVARKSASHTRKSRWIESKVL